MLPLFSCNLGLVCKKMKAKLKKKKMYVQDFLLLTLNSHRKLHGNWGTNKGAMASPKSPSSYVAGVRKREGDQMKDSRGQPICTDCPAISLRQISKATKLLRACRTACSAHSA